MHGVMMVRPTTATAVAYAGTAAAAAAAAALPLPLLLLRLRRSIGWRSAGGAPAAPSLGASSRCTAAFDDRMPPMSSSLMLAAASVLRIGCSSGLR